MSSAKSDCFTCSSPVSILSYLFLLHCFGLCCCLVAQLCLTLCDPLDCSMPGFPVLHSLLEFAQIPHIHCISGAIQPSHPLLPSSPFAFNHSQHQGLFQWVDSSHQMAKVLELQRQSIQWIFRVDFLLDWLVWSPCWLAYGKTWTNYLANPKVWWRPQLTVQIALVLALSF